MNKKKICSLILSFAITSQIMLPTLSVSANELNQSFVENVQTRATDLNQIIHIPDVNLKKALNTKYLHQSEDSPITQRQLQSLKGTLYLGSSGISDLTGLEYCKGVTGLYLSYNQIRDLSPIKKLNNLKRLNVTNQEITEKDVIAINTTAEIENVIKGISGEYVVPTKNSQYTYDSVNNKIIFKNITETGEKSYSFNERFTYGSGYTTYFSGNVTQNIISNNITPTVNVRTMYFNESGLVVDGNFGFQGTSPKEPISTKLIIRDSNGNVVDTISTWNADWGEKNTGFQGIISKEVLAKISNGEYTLFAKAEFNSKDYETKLVTDSNFRLENIINSNFMIIVEANSTNLILNKNNFVKYDANAEIKQSYWDGNNFVINGVVNIGNKDLTKYNEKTLIIRDDFEDLIYEIPTFPIDWFSNKGNFNGFQAIIPQQILENLTLGQYSIEIKTKVNDIEYMELLKQSDSDEDINLTKGKMLNDLTYKFGTD
ncbi:hypothetical protein I9Y31_003467, partial [Clostridium perfringens]|nr:hypothetical protein [Clostridium perfringens]